MDYTYILGQYRLQHDRYNINKGNIQINIIIDIISYHTDKEFATLIDSWSWGYNNICDPPSRLTKRGVLKFYFYLDQTF